MPKCKFCQEVISWKFAYGQTPPGEKNLPYNPDGSLHDCRPKPEPEEPKRSVLGTVFPKGNIPEITPEQAIITELTKHTHLLQEILEAVKK